MLCVGALIQQVAMSGLISSLLLVVAHSARVRSVAILRWVAYSVITVVLHRALTCVRVVVLELEGAGVCVDVLVVLHLLGVNGEFVGALGLYLTVWSQGACDLLVATVSKNHVPLSLWRLVVVVCA